MIGIARPGLSNLWLFQSFYPAHKQLSGNWSECRPEGPMLGLPLFSKHRPSPGPSPNLQGLPNLLWSLPFPITDSTPRTYINMNTINALSHQAAAANHFRIYGMGGNISKHIFVMSFTACSSLPSHVYSTLVYHIKVWEIKIKPRIQRPHGPGDTQPPKFLLILYSSNMEGGHIGFT